MAAVNQIFKYFLDRNNLGDQTGACAGVGNPGFEISVQKRRSGAVDAQFLIPSGRVVSISEAGLFHLLLGLYLDSRNIQGERREKIMRKAEELIELDSVGSEETQ